MTSRASKGRPLALHHGYRRRFPMRTIPRIVLGCALSLAPLMSTAVLAQDSYDLRRHYDFGAIKTFAFKETPPIDAVASKTTTYDRPLIRERTNAAIASQLERRGMTRNDQH